MNLKYIFRFVILIILTFNAQAQEPLIIPQTLLDQVEQGNAEVAYYIATQFDLKSIDEPENENTKQAQDWMKKAAEMDYPQAMYELAEMFEYDEKEAEALEWYQKAATLGMAGALEKIAYFHIKGLGGLARDCRVAYEWYEKAEVYENKLAYNDHAWALATSAYKVCRSPEKALLLISKLMSLYKQEFAFIPTAVLDTQAAVYASVSDFNKAIEIQKIAIENLGKSHNKLDSYKERLNSYQQRKAWIQKKEM